MSPLEATQLTPKTRVDHDDFGPGTVLRVEHGNVVIHFDRFIELAVNIALSAKKLRRL